MAHPVIMPKLGMSMESGTILRWLKSPGDPVRRGEALLEIETDKVAMEVEAEVDGVLLAVVRAEGEVVAVTETIGHIGAPGETPPVLSASVPAPPDGQGPLSGVPASPLARTLARERGLELGGIRGTGPGGAVRARDLPAHEAHGAGPAERSPLMSTRRAIGARMARSHRDVPAVTLHADADVTELEQLRERLNEGAPTRLSLTPFLLKAAGLACRAHPILRSSLDGEELVTHAEVNLGMAVALENGLIVPVLSAVDRLPVARIAELVRDLSHRARERSLSPDETAGAVFTVTNLGMYGVTRFDPLIDPPQSAILGVGAARGHLALVGGQVAVRTLVDLALSFDHRVMDGAQGALALKSIRDHLEAPLGLLT